MNFIKIICRDRFTLISFLVIMVYILMTIGTDVYVWHCEKNHLVPAFAVEDAQNCYMPPSKTHWLGTDYMGRDVFFRAVAGSSTAVKIGIVAGLISAFLGVSLGAIGGFYGGKIDKVVVWLFSTFASMPSLLFILAFSLLFSKGFLAPELSKFLNDFGSSFHVDMDLFAIYLAIGLTGWVTICRVVRAETMKLKSMAYVDSARIAGQRDFIILVRHIIPNLFHLVIIYFTLRFAYAIMTEVIVSYLGLGVQNAPSWGLMIANGQERLWRGVWWEIGGATLFMFILVLALNIMGDSLRDALDPRQQKD